MPKRAAILRVARWEQEVTLLAMAGQGVASDVDQLLGNGPRPTWAAKVTGTDWVQCVPPASAREKVNRLQRGERGQVGGAGQSGDGAVEVQDSIPPRTAGCAVNSAIVFGAFTAPRRAELRTGRAPLPQTHSRESTSPAEDSARRPPLPCSTACTGCPHESSAWSPD